MEAGSPFAPQPAGTLTRVHEVEAHRFEELVGEALDLLPEALAAAVDNLVVVVEDDSLEPGLLGLYEGVPLTERDAYGAGGYVPDVIRVFRLPLCELARDEEHLVEEIRVTVVHEIAHHFGIDDDRLTELGWD